ncbi:MAG: putative nucleotidyltransferase substrate binding domain-containing protein [Bacteroidota bacterium]
MKIRGLVLSKRGRRRAAWEVALIGTHERLFDAVRAMMRYRIRRVIVVDPETGTLRGLLTSEDISQYRGLDPVATTERIERGRSIAELAALRSDSNRRLYRLYHQGVHSEDLLDVVSEVDDQLKQRVLELVEREVREEAGEAAPPEGQWAWLAFGAAGRQESVLRGWQDNGLVYADPAPGTEAPTAAFYETLATRAVEAFRTCGYAEPENNVSASHASFRQPVSAWVAAYATWTEGADAEATSRAALCFDVRSIYGEESLVDLIHRTIRKRLPNARLSAILARRGTIVELPLSTFSRFEVDEVDGVTGIDLFRRVLLPIVHLARAMALDLGEVSSSNTFDRLRAVAESDHVLARQASALLPAYTTLLGLRLRSQMQAAEVGDQLTDQLDPETLNKSQQNLLKESLRSVQAAQTAVRKHFGL